jgi:hypothetical protein
MTPKTETGIDLMTDNNLVVGQLLADQNARHARQAQEDLRRLTIPPDHPVELWQVEEFLRGTLIRLDVHAYEHALDVLYYFMVQNNAGTRFGGRMSVVTEPWTGKSRARFAGRAWCFYDEFLSALRDSAEGNASPPADEPLPGGVAVPLPDLPLYYGQKWRERVCLKDRCVVAPKVETYAAEDRFGCGVEIRDSANAVRSSRFYLNDAKAGGLAAGHTILLGGHRHRLSSEARDIVAVGEAAWLCLLSEPECNLFQPLLLGSELETPNTRQVPVKVVGLQIETIPSCIKSAGELDIDAMSIAITGYLSAYNPDDSAGDAAGLDHPQLSLGKAAALIKGDVPYDEAFFEPEARHALAELGAASNDADNDEAATFIADRLINPRRALSLFLGRELPKCDQLG